MQDEPRQDETLPEQEFVNLAQGDFRGRYGYGRPAHRADPEARYEFRGAMRQLPVRESLRWSVTG